MAWDPQTYLAFDAERTRPAQDLLARVDCAAPERVADLGCGPGNSTAVLAARWPEAALEGIDNSPAMLADARQRPFRATWTLADIAGWTAEAPFDVIFSNAALHWVADHVRVLPQIVRQLVPGGIFAFQVPRSFSEPGHALMLAVADDPRWKSKLDSVHAWSNVLEPAAYFDILEPVARSIDLWETRYVQVLEGEDAVFRWVSGTALRPFAQALDGAEREAFLDAYRKRVAQAYPRRANGTTLYPFQRLFCVMRKR